MITTRPEVAPEVWELITGACEGSLSSDQLGELESQLLGNPRCQRALLDYCALHADLHLIVGIGQAVEKVRSTITTLPDPATVSSISERLTSSRESRHQSSVPIRFRTLAFGSRTVRYIANSPLAATLLVAMFIYGVFGFLAWDLRSKRLSSDAPIAVVSDLSDVEWPTDHSPKLASSPIQLGEALKIDAGLIELELKRGVKLLVEGPARWSIDGDNRVTLTSGRLVAQVPKTAIGFTVQTPAAVVVDLGTEFGVEITNKDSAQVTVFKGMVRVEPNPAANTSGKQLRSTTVSAGESRRIVTDTANGGWSVEQSSSTNFIRKFKQESTANGSMLPPHLIRMDDSEPQRITRREDAHFQVAQDDLLQTSLDPAMPVRPAAETPGLFPGERLSYLFNGRIYVPERTDLFAHPAAASIHEDSFTPVDRSSVEFYFDTSKAPQGYDIHRIESISSWLGTRSGQYYLVFVRHRGSSNFERRRLVDVNAPPVATYDYYERRIKISNKGGAPLAKNVDAIRFVFINFETGSDPESKYREIDVIGSPTATESNR